MLGDSLVTMYAKEGRPGMQLALLSVFLSPFLSGPTPSS
jgi:hypothetical protein